MSDKCLLRTILDRLANTIGTQLFIALIRNLVTRQHVIALIDALLDFLEDVAEGTPTHVDDELLKRIRDALNIPDQNGTQDRL